MHTPINTRSRLVIAVAIGLGTLPLCGYAQEKKDLPADHGKHIHPAAPKDAASKDVSAQIAELRARLDRLEAATSSSGGEKAKCCCAEMGGKKTEAAATTAKPSCCCMTMGEKKSETAATAGMSCCCMQMGAMKKEMSGKGGMGMMRKKMMGDAAATYAGTGVMGVRGASKDSKSTGDAPNIYHVGAREFFLDRAEQIVLTPAQQTRLKEIRVKATAERAAAQKKIDQAESELWASTSAESPSADRIETQVRAIEKLRADQRLAFIRAVGEAAKVLTPNQRSALAHDRIETPDHHH